MNRANALPEEPPAPTQYSLISDVPAFEKMMESLLPAGRMAIDIEADSLYHYFDKVCLIQISTDAETFVLDPLAVRDLGPLGPILSDPKVEKVFHACGYDVYCLRRDYGFTFANLFDTHLAGQLMGYEFLGLGALMELLLSVSHSKRRQRDDWSRRPLDPGQLEYAAMDTHHLLRLRDVLEEQLIQKGRISWAREEFQASAMGGSLEKEFDVEGFRRIKGSRELSMPQLAILRALYLLRDRFAREMDLPPFKVLNNSVLLDLSRRPPQSPREMFQRKGISFRVARRFSTEIHHTIEKARREDPSFLALPPKREWKAPSREARRRLENLKAWRQNKAVELQLHVGVVCPGSLLETMSASPPADLEALQNLDGMRRWRALEFGREILSSLHSCE